MAICNSCNIVYDQETLSKEAQLAYGNVCMECVFNEIDSKSIKSIPCPYPGSANIDTPIRENPGHRRWEHEFNHGPNYQHRVTKRFYT